MDTDTAVVELYGLPPEEFVGARNQLPKAIRDGGDEPTAAAIVALRKPTISASLASYSTPPTP